MITRRNFLKTTTLATASALILPDILKAAPVHKDAGLQLYTLRDLIAGDLRGTLKKVAAIGYTWIEAAGYADGKFYGLSPSVFRKMVEDCGLKAISSHAGINSENRHMAIDAHAELGVPFLVLPWISMPEKPIRDDYSQVALMLNDLGDACRQAGMKFAYHNHNFEFVRIDDTTGYDILLNETDPNNVCFESDIFWMVYAGADPFAYFAKYPGRFALWHVKDMDNTSDKGFAPVGTGVIDYSPVFAEKVKAGMSYFFVEQDTCKDDPLKSVKTSYNNLVKIVY